MELQHSARFRRLREHWRRYSLYAVGSILFLLAVAQAAYPWDQLPPYATVGPVNIGGLTVQEATRTLDETYQKIPIRLYFGESDKPYREPKAADIGLTIDSSPQVEAERYPWWLRLIPTSLWWAHIVTGEHEPQYQHDAKKVEAYVKKELGKSCDVKPQNATLAYRDGKLEVVPAADGGTCELADVQTLLMQATPLLSGVSVRVPTDPRPAKVTDKKAGEFATALNARTATGMTMAVGSGSVPIDQETLLSWLDFKAPDSGLVATVNGDRSANFFAKKVAPKVARAAGTSHITTLDFTVIARQDGAMGQAFDKPATLEAMNQWLAGSDETPGAKVKPVAPAVVYTRKYSPTDTGLTALITQFANEHPGEFGVSFVELGGKHRRAAYQETRSFRTASTYKLFIAYSTLKRIDSGAWKWNMQVHGGRDLAQCFDDMIVKSDNPCAETLLYKIGFQALTNEIHAIGLTRSSFLGENITTTAGDLTTLVGALQTKQLPLSDNSMNKLISAMKRNIFRQGIPAGASGAVADKVGFLEDYLNDAAIVYSPSGTYALTIMTKGSSWGAIAELTRKIEALRVQ